MVALVAGLWVNPVGITGGQGWGDRTLGVVFGLQLWVLLVIPLGVLAASDAARAGRRGWLALFIALIVLAPFAASIDPLTNNIQILFSPPCLPGAACPSGPYGASQLVTLAGWAVAFLPVPIATLVYSLTSARSAAGLAAAEANRGERRTLIMCAVAGIVVMSALGYLGTTHFLFFQFGRGSFAQVVAIHNLHNVLFTVWVALAALPVAIASAAMAHAAQTGRRGWLTGWIALIALALLTADIGSLWGEILILEATGATSGQIPIEQSAVSIVAPAVIMLVALIYALTVMRPEPRAAALAAA
jgi:hypothetical protein